MKKNLTKPRSPSATRQRLIDLYEKDEVAWLEKSAKLIRQKRLRELDYSNLAEYLSDMAKRDRREVNSRLIALLAHLLKWQFQPQNRTGSWKASILDQRDELQAIFSSKTLKNHGHSLLRTAYSRAVKLAGAETELPLEAFPKECPYSMEYLLGDEFPGGE